MLQKTRKEKGTKYIYISKAVSSVVLGLLAGGCRFASFHFSLCQKKQVADNSIKRSTVIKYFFSYRSGKKKKKGNSQSLHLVSHLLFLAGNKKYNVSE